MLTDVDIEAMNDFSAAIGELMDLDELAERTVEHLPRMVTCTQVAWNELDPEVPRMRVVVRPHDGGAELEAAAQLIAEHTHEHPGIVHHLRTRDGRPVAISDFLSAEEFHATTLYRQVYRRLGAEDQLSFALPTAAPLIVAMALNRDRRGFSDRDRTLVNLVRPALVTAYRNAQAYSHLRGLLASVESATDDAAIGVVVLDRAGHVEHATPHALHLMARGGAEVADAIVQTRQRAARQVGPAWPTTLRSGGAAIEVRLLEGAAEGHDVVVLTESHLVPRPAQMVELGLTDRQAEVLALVSAGWSNDEVARKLGVRPVTVKKHLERIYDRLGVHNRVAATTVAHAGGVFRAKGA